MSRLGFQKLNLDNLPENFITKLRGKLFMKYGIYRFIDLFPYSWRDFYWEKIKPIFKPAHKRMRKAIPRTWRDLDYIIEAVNMEAVKSFYEDEYKRDIVDWNATPEHKAFANWLEKSYYYITVERPELQKKLDNSYPDVTLPVDGKVTKTSYKKLYGKVEKYEKLINKKDTELLIEVIKKRDHFWT